MFTPTVINMTHVMTTTALLRRRLENLKSSSFKPITKTALSHIGDSAAGNPTYSPMIYSQAVDEYDHSSTRTNQDSTVSAPNSSFQLLSVFWLPPRVSTTSPVLGFL